MSWYWIENPCTHFNKFFRRFYHIRINEPRDFQGNPLCGRLLERVWQMEFYHAARQLLPKDVHISPDVGAVFASEGWMDFYVDDEHEWMIELVRDGEKHREKMKEDGLYGSILKCAKHHAIVDIRSGVDRPRNLKSGSYYHRNGGEGAKRPILLDTGEYDKKISTKEVRGHDCHESLNMSERHGLWTKMPSFIHGFDHAFQLSLRI
ncbi:8114_t:CDS:2 [Paraglomus occultum]|uniref:8114_t:CDS:1 n=1 Tax=Paraglomus occultum TaxID=144539 RepID=A0A9N9B5Y8_9GLOM|nr:8114_t:CDS:2 [Paraglomus occultum]